VPGQESNPGHTERHADAVTIELRLTPHQVTPHPPFELCLTTH